MEYVTSNSPPENCWLSDKAECGVVAAVNVYKCPMLLTYYALNTF